jgi:hypothetical protein
VTRRSALAIQARYRRRFAVLAFTVAGFAGGIHRQPILRAKGVQA